MQLLNDFITNYTSADTQLAMHKKIIKKYVRKCNNIKITRLQSLSKTGRKKTRSFFSVLPFILDIVSIVLIFWKN